MDIFSESKYTNNGYAVSISIRKYDDSKITETVCILNKNDYNVTKYCVGRAKSILGNDVFDNVPEVSALPNTTTPEIRKYMKDKLEQISCILNKAASFYRLKGSSVSDSIGG